MKNNLNKLSWAEPRENDTLEKVLINLGFTFTKGFVPGIENEVYIIDNYKSRKGETFVIEEHNISSLRFTPLYSLYKLATKWETNITGLDNLFKNLKEALAFYGRI